MSDTSSEETDELIYQAVIYKNIDLLQELLKVYPGRVHYTDNHGRTALHIAARNGSVDAVRCLIEAGANVNSMASASALCERPLHVAAIVGNTEIVELLINAGAELLATDLNDHCALELAQMTNHFQTACVLIDAIG
ncbi:hypothetical protein AB6A40_010323 [Gnathostoma spinigerum]|uniref:Uncharacterized protein n=1 Tax=Gnathostoma spinigerum TaxID=75299 RepID=A0ABD6F1B4_9BILA